MFFLRERHPPKSDQSTLATLIYGGNAIIEELNAENNEAFFDQLDQLIEILVTQAALVGLFNHKQTPELIKLKDKARRKALTAKPDDYHYYGHLKRDLEEYCLLIQNAKSDDARDIINQYLLPEIDVCGPGLLTHLEKGLAFLKAGLHYQVFLAQFREGLITDLARHHARVKHVPTGHEIHVLNLIIYYLSQFAFTPYISNPQEDPLATQQLCNADDTDFTKFAEYIRNNYTPSKVIPLLAQDIEEKFKQFFKDSLPFNLLTPGNAEKLAAFYEQLGLPPAIWERISPAKYDENETPTEIPDLPKLSAIETYIWEEFLKTRPHQTLELQRANPSAAGQDLQNISVLIAPNHFYDEISDASQKLVKDAAVLILKSKIEDDLHYQAMTLQGIHLNEVTFQLLYAAGLRDFAGAIFIEPVDVTKLDLLACNFRGATISLKREAPLTPQQIVNLHTSGVSNFRDVTVTEPMDAGLLLDITSKNHPINKGSNALPNFTGAAISLGRQIITPENFQQLYQAGIRNFSEVRLEYFRTDAAWNRYNQSTTALFSRAGFTDADIREFLHPPKLEDARLDINDIDLDACDFTGASIRFAEGTKLNNAQFIRLVNQGVKDFSLVIFTEPLDLSRLNAGHSIEALNLTKARLANPPLQDGITLIPSAFDKLYESGCRYFWNVNFYPPEAINWRKLLSSNSFSLNLPEKTIKDASLSDNEFHYFYNKLGIRTFENIIISSIYSFNGINFDECTFKNITVLFFAEGTKLSNAQFRKLVAAGVKNFSNVTFLEPLQVDDISFYGLHLTPIRFAEPPFQAGSQPLHGISSDLFEALYFSGVRNFQGMNLSGCVHSISKTPEEKRQAERDHIITPSEPGQVGLPIQLQDAIISEKMYYFLRNSLGIKDFSQMILDDQWMAVNDPWWRKDRRVVPTINTERRDASFFSTLKQFKSFAHFKFVDSLAGIDLSRYKFKDCSFREATGCWLYSNLDFSFCTSLKNLLLDYTNCFWPTHRGAVETVLKRKYATPEDFLRALRAEIGDKTIKPTGALMQRLRIAIEHHSCFGNKTVDEVLAQYGFPANLPSAAPVAAPFAAVGGAGAMPLPSAAAGAGAPRP